jgi:4-diphosphocytidyl-2-C-methyl-D-erythritol kinase
LAYSGHTEAMPVHRALAPAKINLGLFLGPSREDDGRHELVSVMQSISLADELQLAPAAAGAHEDQIVCPDVAGEPGANLAARALSVFRAATGWDAPAQRLSIVKRIPLAAGLGGGSADAAATLRLASAASGLGDQALLRELGADLGADVPAQIEPGRWLATGAGERLEALPDPFPALELLVLPSAAQLSTAAVYAAADELGLEREPHELEHRRAQLRVALELGAPLPAARELLHNDLQPAAVSLAPQIAGSLRELQDAGAEEVILSGSGPTVVGLFTRANASGRVQRAAAQLSGRAPTPIPARSVDAEFGRAALLVARGPNGVQA